MQSSQLSGTANVVSNDGIMAGGNLKAYKLPGLLLWSTQAYSACEPDQSPSDAPAPAALKSPSSVIAAAAADASFPIPQ